MTPSMARFRVRSVLAVCAFAVALSGTAWATGAVDRAADVPVETAGRIGARSTWFIHMSHEIRHAEVAPGLPAGMNLAWDGVQLG